MEAILVQQMRDILTCPLCDRMFNSPVSFDGCKHTFCRECVVATLEGPRITTSQCPTCSQPGWKNQLRPEHKLAQLVAIATGLLEQGGLPATSAAPADQGACSAVVRQADASGQQAPSSGSAGKRKAPGGRAKAGSGEKRHRGDRPNHDKDDTCAAPAAALGPAAGTINEMEPRAQSRRGAAVPVLWGAARGKAAGQLEAELVPDTYPAATDGCEPLQLEAALAPDQAQVPDQALSKSHDRNNAACEEAPAPAEQQGAGTAGMQRGGLKQAQGVGNRSNKEKRISWQDEVAAAAGPSRVSNEQEARRATVKDSAENEGSAQEGRQGRSRRKWPALFIAEVDAGAAETQAGGSMSLADGMQGATAAAAAEQVGRSAGGGSVKQQPSRRSRGKLLKALKEEADMVQQQEKKGSLRRGRSSASARQSAGADTEDAPAKRAKRVRTLRNASGTGRGAEAIDADGQEAGAVECGPQTAGSAVPAAAAARTREAHALPEAAEEAPAHFTVPDTPMPEVRACTGSMPLAQQQHAAAQEQGAMVLDPAVEGVHACQEDVPTVDLCAAIDEPIPPAEEPNQATAAVAVQEHAASLVPDSGSEPAPGAAGEPHLAQQDEADVAQHKEQELAPPVTVADTPAANAVAVHAAAAVEVEVMAEQACLHAAGLSAADQPGIDAGKVQPAPAEEEGACTSRSPAALAENKYIALGRALASAQEVPRNAEEAAALEADMAQVRVVLAQIEAALRRRGLLGKAQACATPARGGSREGCGGRSLVQAPVQAPVPRSPSKCTTV